MQELFIEIRKKLVEKESSALDFVYDASKLTEATRKQMDENSHEYHRLEESACIPKE